LQRGGVAETVTRRRASAARMRQMPTPCNAFRSPPAVLRLNEAFSHILQATDVHAPKSAQRRLTSRIGTRDATPFIIR
jgi:hypothetical protein